MKLLLNKKRIIPVILIMLAVELTSHALPKYASSSKLSHGKWVKIEVGDNGVYEISDTELKSMGFSVPEKVKIFGRGGTVLPEPFSLNSSDDISQIPSMRADEKMIFFGCGPISVSALTDKDKCHYYGGTVNPYSLTGCYFLTDSEDYSALTPVTDTKLPQGTNRVENSYDYRYHEKDLVSFGQTGKQFFGEDFSEKKHLDFDLDLPNVVSGQPIVVSMSSAGKVDKSVNAYAKLNEENIPFTATETLIQPVSSTEYYYNICSSVKSIVPTDDSEKRVLTIGVDDVKMSAMRLNYYSITYQRRSVLPTDSSQVWMGYFNVTSNDVFVLPKVEDGTVVWNIDSKSSPIVKTLRYDGDEATFAPSSSSEQQYVMFNTKRQLKTITTWSEVENQDLHAKDVPEMVIVCRGALRQQAERVAEMHHRLDGMDVLVVDEEQIFNEFSSGTPDATAYRLFLKMLYDRNPEKLQYLLLFGCCSYDNRSIGGKRSDYQLLSYQSEESRYELSSYTCDDYFALLGSTSGSALTSDAVTLGVGRMPVATVAEAEKMVDKLKRYVEDDDWGVWHNNTLLLADEGDDFLHCYQAEGVSDIMGNMTQGAIFVNKVYVPYFVKSDSEAVVGRNEVAKCIENGQLLMSYVGHAGPVGLTHGSKMWREQDAATIQTEHPTIGFFAACNTAHYDSESRGIGETMFFNENGGAIAMVVSARTAYSSQNDKLNQAFIKSALKLKDNGDYKTVGEAFRDCKLYFYPYSNLNKMNFALIGDPALKVQFPKPQCRVNSVNGEETGGTAAIKIYPLTQVTVQGVVTDAEGNTDTSFDGTVNVRLYDKEEFYDLSNTSTTVTTRAKKYGFTRDLLNEATGIVKRGVYEVKLLVPENCKAQGDSCLMSVFATDGQSKMVAASEQGVTIEALDESLVVVDDELPEVKMTVGDGSGITGVNVEIKISVTDNQSINMTSSDPMTMMSMSLDGGKKVISPMNRYLVLSDDGKKAEGMLPLVDLSVGKHTLTFSVCDVAGNWSSTSTEFDVVDDAVLSVKLKVDKKTVVETVDVELDGVPATLQTANFRVCDVKGNVVVTQIGTSDVWQWNLKDNSGERVAPGRYVISASFTTDTAWGHSDEVEIVVLLP